MTCLEQLPQVLDLSLAQALRDRVAEGLRAGALTVDAGAVERVSTPCLQVLLAAGRAAEQAGTSYSIVNASDAFGSALADLGLRTAFSKWIA